MKHESEKSKLCPFKKITEMEYSGRSGKKTINERFAPCAGERCMAFQGTEWNPRCARVEGEK